MLTTTLLAIENILCNKCSSNEKLFMKAGTSWCTTCFNHQSRIKTLNALMELITEEIRDIIRKTCFKVGFDERCDICLDEVQAQHINIIKRIWFGNEHYCNFGVVFVNARFVCDKHKANKLTDIETLQSEYNKANAELKALKETVPQE